MICSQHSSSTHSPLLQYGLRRKGDGGSGAPFGFKFEWAGFFEEGRVRSRLSVGGSAES
jgi:hypothetical protein